VRFGNLMKLSHGMHRFGILMILLASLCLSFSEAKADLITFDFNGGPLQSPLPLNQFSGGLTAHFTATGDGYSIQQVGTLGISPVGFSGNCLYPSGINSSDLVISFDQPLSDISLLYSPHQLATDTSCTMRITAYRGSNFIGTNTNTVDPPGTWPTGTLALSSALPFDNVVVHYDQAPPTGGDWGPNFLVDDITVTTVPEPGSGFLAAISLLFGLFVGLFRRRNSSK